MTGVLRRGTHSEEERHVEMEAGRDRGYVAGSQEMPGVTRLRWGKEGFFPEPSVVEWLC